MNEPQNSEKKKVAYYEVDPTNINALEGTRDFFNDQINSYIYAYLDDNGLTDDRNNPDYVMARNVKHKADNLLNIYYRTDISSEEKNTLIQSELNEMSEMLTTLTDKIYNLKR